MPPKRKDLLKPKGKPKSKTSEPQSENDFLEAADDHEQSAGKWRAGDPAKATRFFNRAIDTYTEGLKRFPHSFDLAYNKANLEFNMCEDDQTSSQLGNRTALLEETLKSHRAAIALNPENIDVRFNTAQVLTSLAEGVLESETHQIARIPARTLLEEAVDLFAKCLMTQQREYESNVLEMAKAQEEQRQQEQVAFQQEVPTEAAKKDQLETASTGSSAPDEWATVEEPLTPESILETCTAQLSALTTLLGLYDPSDLPNIEAKAQGGLETGDKGVPTLISLIKDSPFHAKEEPTGPTLSIGLPDTVKDIATTPKEDALLAVATFRTSLAEIAYRRGNTAASQYASEVEALFSPLIESLKSSDSQSSLLNALTAYADALIDIASSISDTPSYPSVPTSDVEVQWAALTRAQTALTTVSTGTNASLLPAYRLSDTFLGRGDIDLFRFRITFTQGAKSAWVNSRGVLVKNAGVFYRGGRSYAEKAGKLEVGKVADTKSVIAEVLKEVADSATSKSAVVAKDSWKGRGVASKRVLEQMVEEGILGQQDAEGVLRLLE